MPVDRVVWTAPGRVNLIGDHTDYADGLVLPFAVPMRTRVEVVRRTDARLQVTSEAFEAPHRTSLASLSPDPSTSTAHEQGGWAAYVEGAVWLVGQLGLLPDGVEVRVSGGVPAGAGLASSAAVVTACLGALTELAGARWSDDELALAARTVENEYVGAPVGVMDPWVVAHARHGHALLLDTRSLATEHVPLPLVTPGAADVGQGWSVLVVDTGTVHRNTGATYAERVSQVRAAADALGVRSLREVSTVTAASSLVDPVLAARARHVVTENGRVLAAATRLRSGAVDAVGPLLTESHRSLRDDFGVSTPELDLVVETALAAGAAGARLTGAGTGGCALALVPVGAARPVQQAVVAALAARLGREPRSWFVAAADGARPDRP